LSVTSELKHKKSDLWKEIDKLIELILSNRTLVAIARGRRNPTRKQRTQVRFVREANFIPVGDMPEPSPDTEA